MEAALPVWFEVTAYVVLLGILAFDLFLAFRRPHIPSTRESALWVSFYVVLALVFAGLMLWQGSVDHAAEFIAGWVTEYSLSIDNLFVFVIIMARFSVPRKYQQEVLMVGIIIALVLAIFDPEAISRFIGEESGFVGMVSAGLVGAITLIPGFIAFPAAGELLRNGAGTLQIATFVSSLMMVGLVTLPMEVKYLGKRVALTRNALALAFSFVAAYFVALVVAL